MLNETDCITAEHCIYKKFKKISKRNPPNVGMSGWMEALADKVHKQGAYIPQHLLHFTQPSLNK